MSAFREGWDAWLARVKRQAEEEKQAGYRAARWEEHHANPTEHRQEVERFLRTIRQH